MSYFTVFTPTYNRAYILTKAYDSLVQQTFQDFLWLIMDDGSADDTENLVAGWINEGKIKIEYHKQQNMGRFGAFNNAAKYFTGELVTFLDSDDYLKANALAEIRDTWENRDKSYVPEPIGIIYYMEDHSGRIHGNELPDVYCEHLFHIRGKYRVEGDKAQVYKREIIQKSLYPLFPGEKFIGDSIIMNRMNENGGMIVMKKSLYVRDYPDDSLTKNIANVHYHSPRGMALFYKESMKYYNDYLKRKLNCAMKYVTFSSIARQRVFTNDLDSPFLVGIMYIPGLFYSILLRRRAEKTERMKEKREDGK